MKLLLLLMSGLEISDAAFTHFAVGKQLVNEANPLMDSLVHNGDFILLKVIGALVCSICLWLLYKRFKKTAVLTAAGIVVFYSVTMIWNFGVTAFL